LKSLRTAAAAICGCWRYASIVRLLAFAFKKQRGGARTNIKNHTVKTFKVR